MVAIMKLTFITLIICASFSHSTATSAEPDWISLFNGKDLANWKSNVATEEKANEKANTFSVEDGKLKISNGRAHIFYVGPDGNAKFKNFEFKAKVMTTPGSNSGIYIHTAFVEKGWPVNGYECQVNATHSDRKKTGGLYAVADVMDQAPNKDNVWFDYFIKVEGKHIIIKIDDKITSDWTEPEDWDPKKTLKGMEGRKLSEGTIALQGHDPKSTTFYKDIFIKPLP